MINEANAFKLPDIKPNVALNNPYNCSLYRNDTTYWQRPMNEFYCKFINPEAPEYNAYKLPPVYTLEERGIPKMKSRLVQKQYNTSYG